MKSEKKRRNNDPRPKSPMSKLPHDTQPEERHHILVADADEERRLLPELGDGVGVLRQAELDRDRNPRGLEWAPKSVTTSDSKHRSAPHQHGHHVTT